MVERAKRLGETDDVRAGVMKMASELERWAEVDPAMFEDMVDEELQKYEKFRARIREGEGKQKELLEAIEVPLTICLLDYLEKN